MGDDKYGGMMEETAVISLTDLDGMPSPIAGMKTQPLPPGPRPWLELGDGSEDDQVLIINKPLVILGRVENVADLVIDDDKASRHHAAIGHCDGEFTVFDMGSTNGTYVNGERVAQHRLQDGTEIRIGSTVLTFRRG